MGGILGDTLDDVLAEAAGLLAEGAADPGSAFRHLALATVRPDGPGLRTMVLRGFDAVAWTVDVHTDRRSAKLGELGACDRACLLGWDRARGVQLRLAGTVGIHVGDAVADAAWEPLSAASRATYRVAPAPGISVSRPQDVSQALDEAAARAVFTVLRLRVAELEWLHLARTGNRRAVFRWAGGPPACMWLSP